MPRQTELIYSITLFRRGVLTAQLAGDQILHHLTEDNVAEVIALSPPEIVDYFKETSARLPAEGDVEGWAKVFSIPKSDDEFERRWRAGLMAFRRLAN